MKRLLGISFLFFSLASFLASFLAYSLAANASDSGCGLGSVIIQKNSKLLQLLSWTTNGIFFTQPLGITSGTSGCSASGLVSNDKEMRYFVELNNDDLLREMARGDGEKLQTLAQMNGCQDSRAQKAFFDMTKKSFGQIYATPDAKADDVLMRLRVQMKSSTEIREMCHIAG